MCVCMLLRTYLHVYNMYVTVCMCVCVFIYIHNISFLLIYLLFTGIHVFEHVVRGKYSTLPSSPAFEPRHLNKAAAHALKSRSLHTLKLRTLSPRHPLHHPSYPPCPNPKPQSAKLQTNRKLQTPMFLKLQSPTPIPSVPEQGSLTMVPPSAPSFEDVSWRVIQTPVHPLHSPQEHAGALSCWVFRAGVLRILRSREGNLF